MVPELATPLFWMLLPLAFVSGWWVATKKTQSQSHQAERNTFSAEYFRGLNYLLNEQPDKAIEVFIRMLDVQSETVETHMALGNLFRRKGEVDRAIRIHQNLIARPTLDHQQRSLALLELGMDYMRSGLLDRAESLFLQLLEADSYTIQASRQLVSIYQQEREWDDAIKYTRRLEIASGEAHHHMAAQFICEQAELAINKKDYRQAKLLLKKALTTDSACVRASLLQAQIYIAMDEPRNAIRELKKIEKQDVDFIPEAMGMLQECYLKLGMQQEFSQYLKSVCQLHDGITPVLMLADVKQENEGVEAAIEYMASELRKRPSVRGLGRLIEYALINANGETRENLLIVQSLTDKLQEKKHAYNCTHCGFTGKSLHWQCPGCKYWNTVKPIQGVIGE